MEFSSLNLLYDVAWMSVLLLIAKVIRSKVHFVQKLYIPSALIAGFMGLFAGKQFLHIIPFSSEISSYAGILIAFVFGSMFIGNKTKVSFKNMFRSVGDSFLVNAASEITQFGLFILLGIIVFPIFFKEINPAFGLMLPAGFVGGHGTAAAIGSVLSDSGWKDATSIGQTFATIGLLGGILGGVAMINIGARKGKTAIIKSVEDLQEEMLTGLIQENDRSAFGTNTVNAMSIDTLTWHFSLILVAVGMAYGINTGLKAILPAVSFPVYGLALVCSIILQGILKMVKLDDYVDKKSLHTLEVAQLIISLHLEWHLLILVL